MNLSLNPEKPVFCRMSQLHSSSGQAFELTRGLRTSARWPLLMSPQHGLVYLIHGIELSGA